MVSLLSIGIEENNAMGAMGKIPCAYADAKNIYDTFENVLGNNIKEYASVCVKNITAMECHNLISALSLSVDRNDVVIFYFSGHGVKNANGKLQLVFTDYCDDGKKGTIYLSEIILKFNKYNCPALIILDCCYSGASIAEAISGDYKLESSISIVTSTGAAGTERIKEDGSEFTNAVCTALRQIKNQEEQISVHNVVSYINDKYPSIKSVIGGGKTDIVLFETERVQYPKDFSQGFIDRVSFESYEMREVLWYSAGYLPQEIKIDLLENYLKKNQGSCNELSWRVRRAIGSIYEYGSNDKIDQYIERLIRSEKWMDKCVGYLCARKSQDKNITDFMYNEIKEYKEDYPMDLLWLLMLYLSDRNVDSKILLKTNLMKSPWGVMEVWKRCFNDYSLTDKLKLFEGNVTAPIYNQLRRELYFKGVISDSKGTLGKIRKYADFIKELYKCKTRGKIKVSEKNKWIFSVMYGNWRDQVDLNRVLENKWKSTRDKKELLGALGLIPSVEIKMAILDYFSRLAQEKYDPIYEKALVWGLKDPHPWVVRSALPLFKGKPDIVKDNISSKIDMKIYPGIFDLAIELARQGLSSVEYPINGMNEYEKEMLEQAIGRECKV